MSAAGARFIGRAERRLAVCASTNDEAAAWARAGAPEGAVVIAEEQERGRGRLGRTWHSPRGENLYFSTVLRPRIAPHLAPPLTLVAAVALAEAVAGAGADPELKWPNDVLLDGRKVAGILTEMATSGARIEHVIVGIGVNLETRRFPDELAARATSLALALALPPEEPVDREAFIAALCAALERWYLRFLDEGTAPVVAAWRARARLFGRRVEIAGGGEPVRGVAEALDDDGALVVRSDDGTRVRVMAGELSLT